MRSTADDAGRIAARNKATARDTIMRRVRLQLGLENAALLPRHVQVILEIAGVISGRGGFSRPLNGATARELPQVRGLLCQLPQTQTLREFLAATKNGPIKITI